MGLETVVIGSMLAGAATGAYSAYEQKKQAKKTEEQMKKQLDEEQKRLDEEEKKKKEKTLGYYESLRGGNTSLLAPKENQVIG